MTFGVVYQDQDVEEFCFSIDVSDGCDTSQPGAPISLTSPPGNGSATLSWMPPADDGGSAIIDYLIQRLIRTTAGWVNVTTTIPATTRSFDLTGRRNGTHYYFSIAAVNAAGTGTWSPTIGVVPSSLAGSGYYFANCTAVEQAGSAPLLRTQPGYRTGLDRDRDGLACE